MGNAQTIYKQPHDQVKLNIEPIYQFIFIVRLETGRASPGYDEKCSELG